MNRISDELMTVMYCVMELKITVIPILLICLVADLFKYKNSLFA